MTDKDDLRSKSYSVLNYLFVGAFISWIVLRVLFLISPDIEWTGFIERKDIIYVFDAIPLSWFHGFYLYEISIGLLRVIVIIAVLIIGLNWLIKRKNPKFVFSSKQKNLYKVAVAVLIISILALISYLFAPLFMNDLRF